jgi:ABC-type multidrug transport system fused ATPase/permease subunit
MPTLAAEWHVGQVFLSLLWFALFFIFVWLLFIVFADIFRSHDMSGWAKTLWVIFIIILPFLGIFVYLIARGGSMHERSAQQAKQIDTQFRAYVQDAASSGSVADEIARLAALRDAGTISEEDFQRAKSKVLSGTSTTTP